MVGGDELRAVMARFPAGVAVITVEVRGQRAGLTVASLVSLSLEPPLVGFAVRRDAALHELLRESEMLAVSMLATGQEALAQHFARGVPPALRGPAGWQLFGLHPLGWPLALAAAVGACVVLGMVGSIAVDRVDDLIRRGP